MSARDATGQPSGPFYPSSNPDEQLYIRDWPGSVGPDAGLALEGVTTVEASFTADSILLVARSTSFIADSVLLKSQAASLTADSVLLVARSTSFTADAFIQLFFTADAYISAGGTEVAFTADAVLSAARSASFTADAVLLVARSASFTADAAMVATISSGFTADAVLLQTRSASFTADAALVVTNSSSFTANAVLKKTGIAASFTADAAMVRTISASFTANAVKRITPLRGLTSDAYIQPPYVIQHARTGPHTGVDTELANYVAWAFDRYLRGQPLREVLIDIDARLTAREAGIRLGFQRLLTGAVLKASRSASFLADAYFNIVRTASFVADAFILPAFRASSFITNASIYISDSIAGAVDWGISTTPKGAFINTASLTSEVGDPEADWGPTDKTGWAKFTLSSTQTVRVSTDYTGYDSVIQLFGPGSPTDANFIDYADDSDFNPGYLDDYQWGSNDFPYPYSEFIETTLTAGTYYVEVFPFDASDIDFNIMLNMQIV